MEQYNCLRCNKSFASRQSKSNHKKICKKPYDIPQSKWKISHDKNTLNQNLIGRGFIDSLLEQKEHGVDLESKSDDKLLSEKSDIEGENLEERLEKLYFEDKAKNRNELLYILGKMLYYGKITLKKFRIVNKVLLDIEEDDEDEDKEKDDKWSLIQSTTDFMTKPDKDKLKKLIKKFKTFEDSEKLEELEKLIDDEQLEYETVSDQIRVLENSDIPRHQLLKFEIILKNMAETQYRIRSILLRLSDIDNEERFADMVKSLASEGLISEDTRKELLEKDAVLELKAISDIIKTKVGSGLYLTPYL